VAEEHDVLRCGFEVAGEDLDDQLFEDGFLDREFSEIAGST
jgi:hypothetical protein